MATNGKITMAVLSTKLDTVIEKLESYDTLVLKVDRLEQSEFKRGKHFWAIYPAIVVGYILWFMGLK